MLLCLQAMHCPIGRSFRRDLWKETYGLRILHVDIVTEASRYVKSLDIIEMLIHRTEKRSASSIYRGLCSDDIHNIGPSDKDLLTVIALGKDYCIIVLYASNLIGRPLDPTSPSC